MRVPSNAASESPAKLPEEFVDAWLEPSEFGARRQSGTEPVTTGSRRADDDDLEAGRQDEPNDRDSVSAVPSRLRAQLVLAFVLARDLHHQDRRDAPKAAGVPLKARPSPHGANGPEGVLPAIPLK